MTPGRGRELVTAAVRLHHAVLAGRRAEKQDMGTEVALRSSYHEWPGVMICGA